MTGVQTCALPIYTGKKFDWVQRTYDQAGPDLLTVEHLKVNERISDISFRLKKGEILGFAGLMGSGRTEILETLFGLRNREGGTVSLKGVPVNAGNPGEAIRNGFALIPEDRRKKGLVLIHSVKENAILPKVAKLRKQGIFVVLLITSIDFGSEDPGFTSPLFFLWELV